MTIDNAVTMKMSKQNLPRGTIGHVWRMQYYASKCLTKGFSLLVISGLIFGISACSNYDVGENSSSYTPPQKGQQTESSFQAKKSGEPETAKPQHSTQEDAIAVESKESKRSEIVFKPRPAPNLPMPKSSEGLLPVSKLPPATTGNTQLPPTIFAATHHLKSYVNVDIVIKYSTEDDSQERSNWSRNPPSSGRELLKIQELTYGRYPITFGPGATHIEGTVALTLQPSVNGDPSSSEAQKKNVELAQFAVNGWLDPHTGITLLHTKRKVKTNIKPPLSRDRRFNYGCKIALLWNAQQKQAVGWLECRTHRTKWKSTIRAEFIGGETESQRDKMLSESVQELLLGKSPTHLVNQKRDDLIKKWIENTSETLKKTPLFDGSLEHFYMFSNFLPIFKSSLADGTVESHIAAIEPGLKSHTLAYLETVSEIPRDSSNEGKRYKRLMDRMTPEEQKKLHRIHQRRHVKASVNSLQRYLNSIAEKQYTYKEFRLRKASLYRHEHLAGTKAYEIARNYLIQLDSELIETFRDSMLADIKSAKTEGQLKSLEIEGGAGPNVDAPSATSLLIRKMAGLRRTELAEAHRLRFFSPQERQWIKGDRLVLSPPSDPPEPTAESIKMAILRELANMPGATRSRPNATRAVIPGARALGIGVDVYINRIDKVKTKDGKTSVKFKNGFVCAYLMGLNMVTVQTRDNGLFNIRGGSPVVASLNNQLRRETSTKPRIELFVLTETGWRVPSIESRGRNFKTFFKTTKAWDQEMQKQGFNSIFVDPIKLQTNETGN